jgi:hypothetical protein
MILMAKGRQVYSSHARTGESDTIHEIQEGIVTVLAIGN